MNSSEYDRVVVVLDWLKRHMVPDLRTEESLLIEGKRRRSDIGVYQLDRLVGIIEVKRPDKFTTSRSRNKARKQVQNYARARKCDWIGWTDGETVFQEYLNTGDIVESKILNERAIGVTTQSHASPFVIGVPPTAFAEFPLKQRTKSPIIVSPELYVHREPADFDFENFLSSEATCQLVLADPDLGKSAYGQAMANNQLWNALYIDGATIKHDILDHLRSEVLEILGKDISIHAFLRDVAKASMEQRAVPFGVVFDSFDEFFAAHHLAAADLAQLIRFIRSIGGKIIVETRPTMIGIFRGPSPLRGETNLDSAATFGPLDGADYERFIAKYLEAREIGGQLVGQAREICRTPGMLDLVTQTYERKPAIEPDLTEPALYRKYRQMKWDRILLRTRTTASVQSSAIYAVARGMRSVDRFALSYAELERLAGRELIAQFETEQIIVPISTSDEEQLYRFKYAGFRDFLISEMYDVEARSVAELITRVDNDERHA